jgi:hypothetical protein
MAATMVVLMVDWSVTTMVALLADLRAGSKAFQ